MNLVGKPSTVPQRWARALQTGFHLCWIVKGGPISRSPSTPSPSPSAGTFAFALAFALPFALPFVLAFFPVPLAVAAGAVNFGCASSSLPLSSGLPPEGVVGRLFRLSKLVG